MAEDTPSLQERADRTVTLMQPDRIKALVTMREEDPDQFDKDVQLSSQDFIALGVALNHAASQDEG